MESKNKIEILQIIRLVSAIFIILYHSHFIGDHGYFGVELFNILSGFLLIYTTEKVFSTDKMFIKKIIRIVPLYWAMTFITYLLVMLMPSISLMTEAKLEYLIKSLFFIPFVNSYGYNVPVLSVGWTLNYEMFFFIIFLIAMKINPKKRFQISFLLTLFICIVGNTFAKDIFIINYFANIYIFEFILGMASFYVYKYIESRYNYNFFWYISAIISFLWLLLDIGVSININRFIRLGLPAFILFISILKLYGNYSFDRRLIKLGNMTYSVYLVEFYTTALYKIIISKIACGFIIQLVLLIVMIIITFMISYIVYLLFEKTITNYLKKKLINN